MISAAIGFSFTVVLGLGYINPCKVNFEKGISFGDCFYPLPSVLALRSAKIHESHFGSWANLAQLDASRVTLVNSFYEFKGPVWIAPSTGSQWTLKFALAAYAALTAGVLTTIAVQKLLGTQKKSRHVEENNTPAYAIGAVSGTAFGAYTWMKFLKTSLPHEASSF